tara:strand:- start:190 stop:411 length:222 start_codon:yes stop_codon:yes gene_type:complete
MRKLLLTTAMFMAMNAWSADYLICTSFDEAQEDHNVDSMEKCVNDALAEGFLPLGGVALTNDGVLAQAMFKAE